MYYIGIDISKFKHDCAVIDDSGEIVTPSWSFTNGHYGMNLKLFLESNNFSFMEFNPLLINRFVKSKSLRKTKSDSIDCMMIAHYLMTVEYKPYPSSFYHTEKLKSLTRFRDSLIRLRNHSLAVGFRLQHYTYSLITHRLKRLLT